MTKQTADDDKPNDHDRLDELVPAKHRELIAQNRAYRAEAAEIIARMRRDYPLGEPPPDPDA